MSNMTIDKMSEGQTFTEYQLGILRDSFGGIETVDPSGDVFMHMRRTVAGFNPEALKQVAGAKIKWLSYLARRELSLSRPQV